MEHTLLIKMLNDLGINDLEAQIFITLLQIPDSTGYKIAGAISKPTANTYKALTQLENKGLIICDESSGSKTYSAIDINEYFNRLTSELNQKRKKIISTIKSLEKGKKKFGNFILSDINQVYEKAKSLIDQSKDILLIDSFPQPYELLKNNIIFKEKNSDTQVFVKLYKDAELQCLNTINSYNGQLAIDIWLGEWLIICKDSEEVLIACFDKQTNSTHHAIWTTDPFICFTIYNGMVNEFMLIDILNKVYQNNDINTKIIKEIHNKYKPAFNYELNAGNKILDIFKNTN
jgi:sugar-specific transcriptional regulator TrmB